MSRRTFYLSALAFLPLTLSGQTSSAGSPGITYDVVSIRPSAGQGFSETATRLQSFTATNISPLYLISYAYSIPVTQISKYPSWARTSRYDVSAKMTEPDSAPVKALSARERQAMLARILTDRFELQTHFEQTDGHIFELVTTKDLHLKLDEQAPSKGATPSGQSNGSGHISFHKNGLTANSIQLGALADILSTLLETPVANKTNLTGSYSFDLNWAPDENLTKSSEPPSPQDRSTDIVHALRDQLGLELRPIGAPISTLVIDHIERPTPN